MSKTAKVAGRVLQLALALLCVLCGQGGDAWIVLTGLDDGGDDE